MRPSAKLVTVWKKTLRATAQIAIAKQRVHRVLCVVLTLPLRQAGRITSLRWVKTMGDRGKPQNRKSPITFSYPGVGSSKKPVKLQGFCRHARKQTTSVHTIIRHKKDGSPKYDHQAT